MKKLHSKWIDENVYLNRGLSLSEKLIFTELILLKNKDYKGNIKDFLKVSDDRLMKLEKKLSRLIKGDIVEFNYSMYIQDMRKNKSPHIRLIGWYFNERNAVFPDKTTIEAEIKRWLRDASFISKYDNAKIFRAHQLVKRKFPEEWNLSTIRKYIPEA